MEKGLLSIIIISYRDTSLVLQRAIDSVKEQSYRNFEIILVNANEKGDAYSLGLLEDMEREPEVKVISCPGREKELAAAKNAGVAASRGEYLGFLRGTDAWNRECAEAQIEQLRNCSDVGMVFCNRWIQDEDALSRDYRNAPEEKQHDEWDEEAGALLPERICSISQVIFRRDVFEEMNGFDTRISRQDEYDMWLRVFRRYRIVGVDRNLVCTYLDKSVMKKSRKLIDVVGYLQLYSKHKDLYDRNPARRTELYRRIAQCYRSAGYYHLWARYQLIAQWSHLFEKRDASRKKPEKKHK